MNTTYMQSPNYTSGRDGKKVDRIVIHWMDGTLGSTDRVFSDRGRAVSAHFGVEDTNVHQYVRLQDTAWHAGNRDCNLHSVGIEHSAQPGRDASDLTYETSSQLIVQICRTLGLTPSRSLLHRHSEYRPTECCGTIDLDRLAARAVEIWSETGIDQPVPQNIVQASLASADPGSTLQDFRVTVTVPVLRVRSLPTTDSMAHEDKKLKKGDTVECVGTVKGQAVDGNDVWLRTKISGLYIWAGGTNKK